MNVTLCSAFRNASGYLDRYLGQWLSLSSVLSGRGDKLHTIWCEGDTIDDSKAVLYRTAHFMKSSYHYDIDLFNCDHGGPDYGSVVNAERFANLSKVWNAIWARIPEDTDAVLFVESDLIWEPSVLLALIDHLVEYPAISPMVMLRREGFPPQQFYDVWAARKDGRHIGLMPPYFPGWDMQAPLQVDSMGSCMAIRGDLARQLHWPTEDVFVGLSRLLYAAGGSIWLDPKATVNHT